MSPRGRIGRFGRVRRRPDSWSSPHERARTRSAERLSASLPAPEAAWLDAHLADCEDCRAIAEAYEADRLLLRQLRETSPEPPRDLWARTAAGIEREGAARRSARSMAGRRRATSLPALSALSGLAVVGVVVVATAISSGLLGPTGRDGPASPSIALASLGIPPQATAITVGAGKVQWLGAGDDGAFAYNVADVDVVCPIDRQPDCPQLADGQAKRVTLTATPKFVFQSPIDHQAVVMGTDASGADSVIVVTLPTPDPTPEPTTAPDPVASGEPSTPPIASPEITSTPTPAPTATPLIAVPSDLVSAVPSHLGSDSLESPVASGDVASAQPEGDGTAIAIISDVTVVGRAAAYSPDGMWFAFSARPVDGSAGPDIYVWHVGDPAARPITTDHASTFASWVGGNVLGSRVAIVTDQPDDGASPETSAIESPPVESPPVGQTFEVPPPIDVPRTVVPAASAPPAASLEPGPSVEPTPSLELVPQAFLADPWTGTEIGMIDAEWQPVVDPTRSAVVAWQGTVVIGSDGLTAAPASGNLVVHPFHGPLVSEEAFSSPSAPSSFDVLQTVTPETSAALSPSVEVSAPASPDVMRDFVPQVVAAGPIADFDARWDETGSWLAIWIADPVDPGLGRLSLLHFDPLTGLIDRPVGAPQDVTALPGFSIGYGRLAWASPPGQGGEGSRIQIAAWTDDVVGAIESIPVEGAIVVQ